MDFFKALNPVSTRSGIMYRLNEEQLQKSTNLQDTEMNDLTVSNLFGCVPMLHAQGAFLSYKVLVNFTYEVIMGNHYDARLTGGGSKGLLDFLVFPLLARKLMADTKLEAREESHLVNVLALCVAGPLEFVRTLMGATLTAVLAITVLPVVWAVEHLMRVFTPGEVQKSVSNTTGNVPFEDGIPRDKKAGDDIDIEVSNTIAV